MQEQRGLPETRLAQSVDDQTGPMSPILLLPPELIYEIADYLPADAILALKLTHRILNYTLPLEPKLKKEKLSSCARFAIRVYLSKPDPKPSHMRCILCKAVYPVAIFSSSSSPACLPVTFTSDGPRPEVVQLPERFCAWHVGRLAKIVRTDEDGRNEWTSKIRSMCMHCGSVEGWAECVCSCGSCGTRRVRTYTRYLNNGTECKRFLFWRSGQEGKQRQGERMEGSLQVKETCWDPDDTNSVTVINLPVYFEDTTFDSHLTGKPACRTLYKSRGLLTPPASPRRC